MIQENLGRVQALRSHYLRTTALCTNGENMHEDSSSSMSMDVGGNNFKRNPK